MRDLRLGTTLVLLALASLVVAASFLLAGETAQKPVVDPESTSRHGAIVVCPYVAGTTCGPVPEPAWVTTGARICVDVAGGLLVVAAGLWLRARSAWRRRSVAAL